NRTLILFDAAYEAFIRDPSLPRSIYEIEGARDVAIEFRSFSKTAGFTGTRCAFTVVPKSLLAWNKKGEAVPLHPMWNRRHTTKFNGVSYPIQRAAEAVYSVDGKQQVKSLIDFYLGNAALIRATLAELGYSMTGGENSPYIWVNVGKDSWRFFDRLLKRAQVVTTPGAGFGRCGKGFIRISAFNSRENVEEAMRRLRKTMRA
ncbi:MAG: aminotransferase class I/II-fold pyridoxal phosphate-dependent enzyme, partial [Kiritimatiellae bacterium]|nr:aminotransferase class I/II-fold pyridoxal phosphate-dependent enzyme [Kiritimatiellia bacterium]